jgi:DNA-binding beta-propeller fold protein YncE
MHMMTRYFVLVSLWTGFALYAQSQTAKQLPATDTSINGPSSLALDGHGHLFVIESDEDKVLSLDLQKGTITTVAGNGKDCCYQDGKQAIEVSLGDPRSIATDSVGNIFLADDSAVRKIDMRSGVISTVVGDQAIGTNSLYFQQIAAGPRGDLFVSDSARIFKIDMDSRAIHLVAGNGSQDITPDDGPALEAGFAFPYVAFDRSSNLIISDREHCRIRRIDHITGRISTIAITYRAGDNCSEVADNGGFGPGPYPAEVAVDAANNIYFVESARDRVFRIDAQASVVSVFAGTGERGFKGDGGPARRAELANPSGLAIDANGNVYIAEYVNNRIRRVDSKTGIITTIAGNGLPHRLDLHP